MSICSKIESSYRATLFSRHDADGSIFYFSAEDFPGLNKEPYSFVTRAGHRLSGCFYSYDGAVDGRLVVFDHGMGTGHRAYMREIELLARHGYLVFSYDHTGCTESEGEGTRGFAGSLADLDSALFAIKSASRFENSKISVIGHSWGGFSTLNIAARHHDVAHVIALSGFTSVKKMQADIIPPFLFPLRRMLYKIEERANPDYVTYEAEESLAETSAKVLIIHSADDKTVKISHFKRLARKLSGKENVRFLLVHGKNHNPNYTREAVESLGKFFAELKTKQSRGELDTPEAKAEFIASYDWWRMTEQDGEVWAEIFKTLSQ